MQYKLPPVTTLGRSETCDIQVSPKLTKVSREHAEIKVHDGNMYVLYDQSAVGTFVNGQKQQQIVLKDGDQISLAGVVELQFSNGTLTWVSNQLQVRRVPVDAVGASPAPAPLPSSVNPKEPAEPLIPESPAPRKKKFPVWGYVVGGVLILGVLLFSILGLGLNMPTVLSPAATERQLPTETPMKSPTQTATPTNTPRPTKTNTPSPVGLGKSVNAVNFEFSVEECTYRDQYHDSAYGYIYPTNDDAVFLDVIYHIQNTALSSETTISQDSFAAYYGSNKENSTSAIHYQNRVWFFAEYVKHGGTLNANRFPYILDEIVDVTMEKNQDVYVRAVFIVFPKGNPVFVGIGNAPLVDVTNCGN